MIQSQCSQDLFFNNQFPVHDLLISLLIWLFLFNANVIKKTLTKSYMLGMHRM